MFVVPIYLVLCAGCSSRLSRSDAAKQIIHASEIELGASYYVEDKGAQVRKQLGSITNVDVFEIFTDGPRARVSFRYEIRPDGPQENAIFNSKKSSQDIYVGFAQPILSDGKCGAVECFYGTSDAVFEKTDNGWKLRKTGLGLTD